MTLPRQYLDKRPSRWVGNNPDRRTVDLAYATTGHKSQGITRDEVLVRVTSAEDRQWLHVDGAGGEHATTAAALRHCAERDHGSGDLAVASWAADHRPSLGAMTPSKTRILLPDENVDKTLRRVTSIWRA